jgi:pimeloyl-ACP methyl ester carboxylesterase
MQADSAFIDANGLKLHYYEAGQSGDPVIVLLHGGGIDSAKIAWRHLIAPLAATHHVYALDLPGYGHSDPPNPDTTYTTPFLLDTLAAFINAVGLDQFALLGLSMGGATALGYTLAHRECVTRLILVDTYGIQDSVPVQIFSYLALQAPERVQKLAWRVPRANRLLLWSGLAAIYFNRLALRQEVLVDAEESIRLELFYEWLSSEVTSSGTVTNYYPLLDSLHTPTLLIHGQFDPSIPLKWPRRAAKALPNGKLQVILLCGHWPNREKPQAFNQAVLNFLRRGY